MAQMRGVAIRTRALERALPALCMVACLALVFCALVRPCHAQAAVATKLSGVETSWDSGYKGVHVDTVKVSPAYGRTVKLYRYDTAEKRFVLERSFTTANKKTARVDVRYPASWKGYAKSIWKIDVPAVKAVKKKVTFKVEADSSAGDAESSDAGDGESAKSSKSTKKSTSKTKTKTIVVRKAMARASAKVKVRCAFLSCKAGVVLDADTGTFVYSYRPFAKRKIASLTKMMTATLLVERKSESSRVRYTWEAANTPWGYGFSYGDSVSVKDAVYAMMLPSSNETATASAIAVSGSVSKFCKLMNKRARELGCRTTVYKNAHGLDRSGAHSTAYDQALIAANILTSPATSLVRKAVKTRWRSITTGQGSTYHLKNTNKLLWSSSYTPIGVKTGTEDDAGRCLAAAFRIGKKRYVTIVLGAGSDYSRYYNTKKLVKFARYAAKHKLPEYEL